MILVDTNDLELQIELQGDHLQQQRGCDRHVVLLVNLFRDLL